MWPEFVDTSADVSIAVLARVHSMGGGDEISQALS